MDLADRSLLHQEVVISPLFQNAGDWSLMIKETTQSKDGDYAKYKTVRLPVETYVVRVGFQIKDEEAAKEAWRQLVKASDCSIITDPVVREEYDISHDETVTVIEGAVVAYPDTGECVPIELV